MPTAQRRHPTMADVAERAGVSVSTVSRTLRGVPSVSPGARRRVEEAADELSFVVSRQASSLVTGKTGTVAVLAPHFRSWFVGSVLTGLGAVLREAGLDLMVYCVSDMSERAAFFDRLPTRRNADALLVISFDLTDEEYARLDGLGVPVVYISQHVAGRAGVHVDDIAASRNGVRCLLNMGHRRIGYVRAVRDNGFTYSSRERLTGYRQALDEAGVPADEELVTVTTRGRRATTEAVGELLALREPPTAVFCEIDQIAAEVLSVLRHGGVDVPGRMSVLGFDDHEMAEWLDLSTIAQPPQEMGRTAGELALSLIDDPEGDRGRHIELPTRLILRGSTAQPHRGAGAGQPDGTGGCSPPPESKGVGFR